MNTTQAERRLDSARREAYIALTGRYTRDELKALHLQAAEVYKADREAYGPHDSLTIRSQARVQALAALATDGKGL